MDNTVYVVGTLHRYQGTSNINGGAVATKTELEQFKRFLKEIIGQHPIRWIAEEMSVEALDKYPHSDLPSGESVPLQVAGRNAWMRSPAGWRKPTHRLRASRHTRARRAPSRR